MSIRIALLILLVIGLSIYAWRNWFFSLCGLVVLMAVIEHPDMPKSIGGFQGLNPWNILMANVFFAWWRDRGRERDSTPLPRSVFVGFVGYALIVCLASFRLFLDPQGFGDSGLANLFSEYLVNSFKWVIPGFLFFKGCRTRLQVKIALSATLAVYVLLALLVIRWIPLRYAVSAGGDLAHVAARMCTNEIGYNRVTLSMMLGGASWAVFCLSGLVERRWQQLGVFGLSGVALLGQALTGGRSGYLAWGIIGCVLCLLRWRRLLLLLPILGLAVITLLPGVRDRLFQGIGGQHGNIVVQDDDYEMTSGRTLAWPYVVTEIKRSPFFGYGREAMTRIGIKRRIAAEVPGESFPHPHNAFLEVLLDNGIVGFFPVVGFFLIMLWKSARLFLDRDDPLFGAAGGAAFALILALFVASVGGQTFYAREGALGMWAAMGIMLRVSAERSRAWETGQPLFAESEGQELSSIDTEPETALESA